MLRRLLVTAIVALATLVPVGGASGHPDACVFEAVMYTPYGPPTPLDSIPYHLVMTIGVCATATTFSATGDMVGFLAMTTGTGVTDTGHRFAFTGAGGVVEVTGEMVGVLQIVPVQHSTLLGSNQNIVHGAVALVNGPPG